MDSGGDQELLDALMREAEQLGGIAAAEVRAAGNWSRITGRASSRSSAAILLRGRVRGNVQLLVACRSGCLGRSGQESRSASHSGHRTTT